MEEIHHPVMGKIKHHIYLLLDALGWISLGLILGFGTMWGALELAFQLYAPYNYIFEVNRTIIFVFLMVICGVAILLRIHQHRREATVGDYWRIFLSLVACMAIGAVVFHMINGLISLV